MSSMWSALGKMTGAVTGVFSASEQPPFDVAWPNKDLTNDNAHEMVDRQHEQIGQLHRDPQWTMIESYHDTDGDMKLFTRPQSGNYHYLKATFTLADVTVEQFVNLVGSSNIKMRQKFSADCTGLVKLDEPTPMTELVHAQYWAPPPVATRDFCFLIGKRDNGDGSYDLWGCSVASDKCPEAGGLTTVRGASLWGWRLIQAGTHLLVSYANCFDPRGWTPGFLLSWLKTTAAKEFCAIRNVLLGKDVKLDKTDFAELGVSAEQIEEAKKQQTAQQ